MPSTKNQRGDLSTTGDDLILEAGSGNATTLTSTATTNRAINLPDAACTLAGANTTQTWTSAQTFNQNTLLINDDDASHTLNLLWNEAETGANRTLNFKVNAGSRTLDLSANLTIGSSAGLTTATGAITLTGDAGGSSALTLANATSVVGGDSNGTDLLTRTGDQSGITNKTFTGLEITAGSTIDTPVLNDGEITIGGTNATGITIGRTGKTTTIAGNLQVNGTTTTVNSTTLDVADVNITVNNGGNQASADGAAGLTVEMSDATDVTLLYDSSLTSKWKAGVSGSEVELADISSNQILTTKSIDADNNTITNIANAAIKAGAAIDRAKLASGTADHVVINSGAGAFSSEAQLAISRGGTGQATATAAFDALAPTTTKGDIIAYSTTNARLPVGADNQVLIADSAQATGLKWGTAIASNPMTTTGDIIYSSDNSGTPARLAGNSTTNKYVMLSTGTGAAAQAPTFGQIDNTSVDASAAIAYSKLNLSNSILNADINTSAAIAYSKLNLSGSIVNADINASAAIEGSKIASASGSVAGVVNTSTQTFAGAKTFSAATTFSTAVVPARITSTLSGQTSIGTAATTFYDLSTLSTGCYLVIMYRAGDQMKLGMTFLSVYSGTYLKGADFGSVGLTFSISGSDLQATRTSSTRTMNWQLICLSTS